LIISQIHYLRKMKPRKLIGTICFILLYLFAQGQNQVAPPPLMNSPYNTMYVHLFYLQSDSYSPAMAARTISPNITDSLTRVQTAIQIKQILDGRGLFVRLNLLPQEQDYIDSLSQKHFYTPFPEKLPAIYLEQGPGDRWFFSQATVNAVPALHKATYPFGTDRLLKLFPTSKSNKFLGLAGWQYVAILILLALIWLGRWLLSQLLMPIIKGILQSRIKSKVVDTAQVIKIAHAISLLLLLWIGRTLLPVLQLPIVAAEWGLLGFNIAITVVVVVALFRILKLVMGYVSSYTSTTESKMDEQLMPILSRIFQIVIVLGGIIEILSLLKVNVTALIAGVSIGGLALALAAQDTVKNLIGSAMIFFDRPFQIGDYVVGSGFAGTIVEVGFRTTRIQSSDTSIISVPNGSIANMVVDNKGMRKHRLFTLNLGLTYDTPPALIEHYLSGLRALLEAHPLTVKESYSVHFNNMEASSLNIYLKTLLNVSDSAEEAKVKEVILLSIMQLAEDLGVRFAFPSTTMYVEEFPEKATGIPNYNLDSAQLKNKVDAFIAAFKNRNPTPLD